MIIFNKANIILDYVDKPEDIDLAIKRAKQIDNDFKEEQDQQEHQKNSKSFFTKTIKKSL